MELEDQVTGEMEEERFSLQRPSSSSTHFPSTSTIWPIVKFCRDFETVRKIGEGKFGEVFLVRSKKKEQEEEAAAAAKFMKCRRASEKLRVRDEIEILRGLEHQNVMRLIGAFEDTEDNFIQVLEYLSGGQLFERLLSGEDEFSEATVVVVIRQLVSAVAYLVSKRVVHLDIKPENIVCVAPESLHIKLADFGFARKLPSTGEELRVTEGTPEFVSPEVVSYEPVTLVTDMWSVGVVGYILLSGLSPFLGEDNETTFENILNSRYSLDEPEFSLVSLEAKEFIRTLLVVDTSTRATPEIALRHRWLKDADLGATTTPTPGRSFERVTSYDRNKLGNFVARSRWQKCLDVIEACSALHKASSA